MAIRSPDETAFGHAQEERAPVYLPAHLLRAMPRDSAAGYTPELRYQAVVQWVVTGTIDATAKALGIPVSTVYQWTVSDWWDLAVNEVQRLRRFQIEASLQATVERGIERTLERLEHGDEVLSQGVSVRLPVKARDAMLIAAMAFDKLRLSQGHATRRTEVVNLQSLRADLGQIVEGESQSIAETNEDKAQTQADTET